MQSNSDQWRETAEQAAAQATEAGRRVFDVAARTGSFLKQGAEFVAADKASYAGRAFWATAAAIGLSAFLLRFPLLSLPLGDILVVALGVPLAALIGQLAFRQLAPSQTLTVRQAFVASATGFAPSLVYDILFLGGRASLLYVTTLLVVSWVIQVFFGTAALHFWQNRLAELLTALNTPLEDEGESLAETLRVRVAEAQARFRKG
ncbi:MULTISPECIES: hypothetical protein [unclassified Variovorax]|uniref:hypothetical protein n=1 Tax=unclassified Variovorax TaxID=663243 RepID=UPI00076C76D4|nr:MULTISPECIES: hypothetical protein [unclassified Variovorax]KWT98274.1 hypothetical protein APY03_0409 [Variovorax sp. WDL1]PNG50071.1 hypothetical protein CHC06_05655 [Variovorax sp. B2]PNG50943.1 hypothetical protein CHC07_05560 [Variovorax sp. B4]VTU41678.1 hypothetical protein SRS16P1_00068 [Variovorax sp. SRS16]VTU41718.1 hypothetical protein E5P1_00068 [Variovorax sp. PBL-E5]